MGTGGLCSPGCGRGLCSGGQVKGGSVDEVGGRIERENNCICVCLFVFFICVCKGKGRVAPVHTLTIRA